MPLYVVCYALRNTPSFPDRAKQEKTPYEKKKLGMEGFHYKVEKIGATLVWSIIGLPQVNILTQASKKKMETNKTENFRLRV